MSRAGRLKALVRYDNVPTTETACGLGARSTLPNAAESPTANNRKGEPRVLWALLRGLRLRRPAHGRNLFTCLCPIGLESELTQHRLTVLRDERRGYAAYVLNCHPNDNGGGHRDPEDYDQRLADVLRALGLEPKDLYAQTSDHMAVCEWGGRKDGICGAAGYRLNVERLKHWRIPAGRRSLVLCLKHAAEATDTGSVLWPPKA